MKYKHIALAAAACFVFSTGFSRCGHRRGEVNIERMERRVLSHVEDMADDLDATEQQQEQLQDVARGLIQQVPALIKDHNASKQTVRNAWRSENPDAAALHGIVDERSRAITAFVHKVVDAGLEVHRILTPEQRQELTEEFGGDE